MEIEFVLQEPRTEENIGASARALKTMGFKKLCLISPQTCFTNKLRYVAHNSHDILENMRIVPDFETAIAGASLVIGTTRPDRALDKPMLTGEQLAEHLGTKQSLVSNSRVVVVFGREKRGMTNQELRRCHMLSYIPQAQRFPALNLSQAVMLYAYLLADLTDFDKRRERWKFQPLGEVTDHLKALEMRTQKLLQRLGFADQGKTHQTMMDRLKLIPAYDVRLLHHLLNVVEDNLGATPRRTPKEYRDHP